MRTLATGRYINLKENDVRPKAILNVVDAYRQLPKCDWNGFLFSSFGKFTRLFLLLFFSRSLCLLLLVVYAAAVVVVLTSVGHSPFIIV